MVAGDDRHAAARGHLAQLVEEAAADRSSSSASAALAHLRARRRGAPRGRRPPAPRAGAAGRPGAQARSVPPRLPRCRSETTAVRTGRDGGSPTADADTLGGRCPASAATTASPSSARSARRARCSDPAATARRRARTGRRRSGRSGRRAPAAGPRAVSRGPVRGGRSLRGAAPRGAPGAGARRPAAGRVAGGCRSRARRRCCRQATWPRCWPTRRTRELISPARVPRPAPRGPEGSYGASPGARGRLEDELRVERLDGARVRIARWILRPTPAGSCRRRR